MSLRIPQRRLNPAPPAAPAPPQPRAKKETAVQAESPTEAKRIRLEPDQAMRLHFQNAEADVLHQAADRLRLDATEFAEAAARKIDARTSAMQRRIAEAQAVGGGIPDDEVEALRTAFQAELSALIDEATDPELAQRYLLIARRSAELGRHPARHPALKRAAQKLGALDARVHRFAALGGTIFSQSEWKPLRDQQLFEQRESLVRTLVMDQRALQQSAERSYAALTAKDATKGRFAKSGAVGAELFNRLTGGDSREKLWRMQSEYRMQAHEASQTAFAVADAKTPEEVGALFDRFVEQRETLAAQVGAFQHSIGNVASNEALGTEILTSSLAMLGVGLGGSLLKIGLVTGAIKGGTSAIDDLSAGRDVDLDRLAYAFTVGGLEGMTVGWGLKLSGLAQASLTKAVGPLAGRIGFVAANTAVGGGLTSGIRPVMQGRSGEEVLQSMGQGALWAGLLNSVAAGVQGAWSRRPPALSGVPASQAEALRRALGRRNLERLAKVVPPERHAAVLGGLSGKTLERFGRFVRSHADWSDEALAATAKTYQQSGSNRVARRVRRWLEMHDDMPGLEDFAYQASHRLHQPAQVHDLYAGLRDAAKMRRFDPTTRIEQHYVSGKPVSRAELRQLQSSPEWSELRGSHVALDVRKAGRLREYKRVARPPRTQRQVMAQVRKSWRKFRAGGLTRGADGGRLHVAVVDFGDNLGKFSIDQVKRLVERHVRTSPEVGKYVDRFLLRWTDAKGFARQSAVRVD